MRAVAAFDLDDFSIFLCLAQERSLTRAARTLGMPKSTVSRRLSLLEDRLKVRLFRRTPRLFALTDAGSFLQDRISPALAILEDAREALAAGVPAITGPLRVGAPRELGAKVCVPLLDQFAKAHPEFPLHVFLSDRVVDFTAEAFDLTFRAGTVKDASLVAKPVMSIDGCLFASPKYLEGRPAPETPEDLYSHRALVFQPTFESIRWPMHGPNGATAQIELEPSFRINSLAAILQLTIDGQGISRMPTYIAKEALADGRVVRVLPEWTFPARTVYLAYAGRRNAPRHLQLLVDFLIRKLKVEPIGA
jgi:DNA-binding transcriptional LysR family regulator